MPKINRESGLVRTILIVIIAIIALSYFGIDIRGIVEAPLTQDNLGYIGGFVYNIWTNYLKAPAVFIWNDFIVGILWETFVGAMDKIKSGEPTQLQNSGPGLPQPIQ